MNVITERERDENDWIGYKCLNCGNKEEELPETGCSSCQSRNVEVKGKV